WLRSTVGDDTAGSSIHIHLVASVGLHSADIVFSRSLALPGLLFDDLQQGSMNVRRELRAVAADIDMGAFLQPRIKVARMLKQAVLHIHLVRPIARKRNIHMRQHTVLQEGLPLGLIEKIAVEVALAEEQPGLAG